MLRVAEPVERGEQHAVGDVGLHPAQDFAEQQAVGEHRQVVAVLLQRGDRNDDRRVAAEGLDRGPGEFEEFHKRSVSVRRTGFPTCPTHKWRLINGLLAVLHAVICDERRRTGWETCPTHC